MRAWGGPPARYLVDSGERTLIVTGVTAIVLAMAAIGLSLNNINYDVIAAVLALTFLTVVSVPIMRYLADRDGDPILFRILLAGFVLKMVGSMVRYASIYILYNKVGDAGLYDFGGWHVAQQLREGNWAPELPRYIENRGTETTRIVWITAFVYLIPGRSTYAAFFVYSAFAYWGCVLFTRAARIALPEIDHRRYEKFVLFLPSLLFWPSSIGKDAWMLGCLGVAAYGAAQLLRTPPRFWGAIPGLLGVGGLALIRPHVAAMAILALGAALAGSVVFGQRPNPAVGDPATSGHRARNLAVKGAALALVAVVGLAVLQRVSGFFGDEGTAAALEQTLDQTSTGGSKFTPVRVITGLELPAATISVFFRPFLFEARSAVMALTALESTVLLTILAINWRRLLSLPRLMLRRPYMVFCVAYTTMFVVGFSNIANFGILARQRAQMLPLMLLLLALPLAGRKAEDTDAAAADEPALI